MTSVNTVPNFIFLTKSTQCFHKWPGGKMIKDFAALRAKTYSYLTDNNDEDKTAKETKKDAIERKFKIKNKKKLFISNPTWK